VEQGRWGTALQKRQTTMAGFQTELTNNLNQLNANIQSDVSSQVAEIARLQSLARQFSLAAIGAGVMFSILAVWYTRRTVLTPINRLIQDVQQVSRAQSASELQPIEPLHQQDEIGELSRAMTRMVNWLRESYGRLEEQVQERTSHLQRRSVQLEVTAQVARDIAATRDLETLLYRAVNTILDRFDFYHAGIFLIDQRQEYAVLRSATGEAGREMLARNHRLKIGETGLVGYVAQRGEARIASDVDMDTVHYKNPLLPETRSEAALPLKAAGRVIGVLDVQSREASAFDEESLAILQIMADQLAIAIQNARLLQESQMNLRELEATYGRYNRQAWDRFIYGRQVMGYDFDGVNALPYFRHALMEAQTMRPEDRTGAPFQIPLRVRNEVIGSLDVWTEEDELSDAEVFLLVTISNRLSQILESARLYEEAQLRAVREQSINQLTASLSRLLETDDVLKAAAQNLGSLPGVSEATVYLNTAGSSAQMLGLVEPDGSPRQDGENGGGDGHRS
jgi:GAF domain-containing protein/HAMP domain-containing protein